MGESILKSIVAGRSCEQCVLLPLCKPASVGIADFERLSDSVLPRRPLERDAALFRAGEPMRAAFIAQTGAFKTVALNEAGDTQVIGFYMPGELIGLEGLATGYFRAEAIALDTAKVCEVPIAALQKVAAQRPEFQAQLMRAMGQGMARHQEHLELLGRKQAHERIAMFLHGLSERSRDLGHDPLLLTLPMSRADIGSYLSLVIETVSRTLSKFQEDGVIAVKGRQIRLLKTQVIESLTHGEARACGAR
jgi:CRP/FNR family transcriptional regulator, anaerobic regulatory protein